VHVIRVPASLKCGTLSAILRTNEVASEGTFRLEKRRRSESACDKRGEELQRVGTLSQRALDDFRSRKPGSASDLHAELVAIFLISCYFGAPRVNERDETSIVNSLLEASAIYIDLNVADRDGSTIISYFFGKPRFVIRRYDRVVRKAVKSESDPHRHCPHCPLLHFQGSLRRSRLRVRCFAERRGGNFPNRFPILRFPLFVNNGAYSVRSSDYVITRLRNYESR